MSERFTRSTSAIVEELHDGALATVEGRIYRLNGSATTVWRSLDSPRTVDEISAACEGVFRGDPGAISEDVRALLNRWCEIGLAQVV